LQNKQQKKQGNENQPDNKQNQGQQNNNDAAWQPARQNQGQKYQQGDRQQGDRQQGDRQQGDRQQGEKQQGYQQGDRQDGGGRRGGREGGGRGGRFGRDGRDGREGGREGGRREGGRFGRGGRRGGLGRDGQPYRFDENKNREYNQRGQNLTGDQRPRGREHDRKSGKFVKNFSNNNVSDFPKVEQEPADWNLESAPPVDNGGEGTSTWTGGNDTETTDTQAGWDDVNQATGDATPSATATKEEKGGKPAVEGAVAKVPEPETKSYEDYLKEQVKKRTELQELLANKQISAPTPRQVVVDKTETGRYVDAPGKDTEQKPKEEKVKKVQKEPKEGKKEKKIIPQNELGFKIEQQGGGGYNRRRGYNEQQEGGSGAGEGENQGNEQSQGERTENRGGRRGGGRRGGRGRRGDGEGVRNARSGRQSNRAYNNNNNNNNRGNGGNNVNVLPSQPEDWPALV
jgi:hypothetical protein